MQMSLNGAVPASPVSFSSSSPPNSSLKRQFCFARRLISRLPLTFLLLLSSKSSNSRLLLLPPLLSSELSKKLSFWLAAAARLHRWRRRHWSSLQTNDRLIRRWMWGLLSDVRTWFRRLPLGRGASSADKVNTNEEWNKESWGKNGRNFESPPLDDGSSSNALAASYLIALTSVPMETAVAFKAAEGGCLIAFSPWGGRGGEVGDATATAWMEHSELWASGGLGGATSGAAGRCENGETGIKASHFIYIEMHNVSPKWGPSQTGWDQANMLCVRTCTHIQQKPLWANKKNECFIQLLACSLLRDSA